jgi:hypothetical protein
MAAVQQNGLALEYALNVMKRDREVVLAALHQTRDAIQFASDMLKYDRHFLLEAVQQNGLVLVYVPGPLKDREMVMAAVQQNGKSLEYAPAFRADPEVACAAMMNTPDALPFVDKSLDNNYEFLKCMIQHRIRPGLRLKNNMVHQTRFKVAAANRLPDELVKKIHGYGGTRKRRRTRKI